MKKQRLDKLLVTRDIARSRSRAKELIDNNKIRINGFPANKASSLVDPQDEITRVNPNAFRWVGRGGRKIWPLIEENVLDPEDNVCIDVGSSTGGFTQALLRADAEHVHAVDVGHGQLDYSLRESEMVTVHENYNFRHANADDFKPVPSIFTMDVSFISSEKLIAPLTAVTDDNTEGLLLLKPQFEAGPNKTDRGILKDLEICIEVLKRVTATWHEKGWGIRDIRPSPLTGDKGNQEYFTHFDRKSNRFPDDQIFEQVVRKVHSNLKA